MMLTESVSYQISKVKHEKAHWYAFLWLGCRCGPNGWPRVAISIIDHIWLYHTNNNKASEGDQHILRSGVMAIDTHFNSITTHLNNSINEKNKVSKHSRFLFSYGLNKND